MSDHEEDIHPHTALYMAVDTGEEEKLRKILKDATQRATIDTRCDRLYGTALALAAYRGEIAIVSLLLGQGADIDIVGGVCGTALGAAAGGGKEAIVLLLLDQGADVNIVGGVYGTALGAAAGGGEEAIVLLLLDQGADINTVGGEYGTALGPVRLYPCKRWASHLYELERPAPARPGLTLLFLGRGTRLSRGADINTAGSKYGTALGVAASRGQVEIRCVEGQI